MSNMMGVLQELYKQSSSLPRLSTSYIIRHLSKDEPIPQFGHGIPESPLAQKEWIWIAYSLKDNQPIALLLAAPMHQLVLLHRMYAINSAPKSVFVGMLRKSLEDMKARGYTSYAVFLDRDNAVCRKLHRLVLKSGGRTLEGNHILAQGPTDIGKW